MKNPNQIRAESPYPWRYMTVPPGRVLVIDARNQEVPLFNVLDLACGHINAVLANENKAVPPSPPL